MKRNLKILMVDDHAITIEGYKSILSDFKIDEYALDIDVVSNTYDAFKKVELSTKQGEYEVIFLDISLPASEELKIFSGEDLGARIKSISPNSKIIVLTMHNENFRLYSILKSLNPNGFLIKSDISPNDLKNAFQDVLNGRYHYSYSVTDLLRKRIINEVSLDELDRSILYYLSTGVKTKNLDEVVPLSLAAIEKRKRNMKEAFGIDKGGDLMLLEKAKKLGFL